MQTKDEIFDTLRHLMIENFEIEFDAITLDAHLYEDLEIDSIDAIDLLGELRNAIGKKIEPQVFKQIRTVGDVVEAVHQIVNEQVDA